MDISLDSIIALAGLFIGGGGGAFFTWRWQRKKAEADAAKDVQDVYQQMVADVKADREEQKQYIAELKDDRKHLRQEREELRDRQDKLEETVRNLQREVARNTSMMEAMRPLLCGRRGCKDREAVTISADGEIKSKKGVKHDKAE